MTINKVRRTILIDEITDKKIRDYQADAIKLTSHSVSYSEIINLLVGMTLTDTKKMDLVFAKIIEKKEIKSK
ncbi:MAG: hypothetical protein KJI69_04175 [Patescibacteria group bacterium]|nr:hypothetical protein [Patescibacteria group bacterium]